MSDCVVDLARGIAVRAHGGQVDKAGRPYIDHPRRVAARVHDLRAKAVAWLHDVVEDTEVTLDDLAAAGVPERVWAAVGLLTRVPGERSGEYYRRIRADRLALAVKLADIADNTDPDRLALLDGLTADRLRKKYRRALIALTS